jgi:hypothetical protein
MTPPTLTMQLALDCADPHAQARFWAAALGYEVEDHHDLILEVIAAGHATEDLTIEIDGRRAWRDAAACRHPEGAKPRLFLQRVPEPKTAKNRFHLDLQVGEERRGAEQARLEGLGATKLYDGQLGPQTWVTMADPEGNEFCVS